MPDPQHLTNQYPLQRLQIVINVSKLVIPNRVCRPSDIACWSRGPIWGTETCYQIYTFAIQSCENAPACYCINFNVLIWTGRLSIKSITIWKHWFNIEAILSFQSGLCLSVCLCWHCVCLSVCVYVCLCVCQSVVASISPFSHNAHYACVGRFFCVILCSSVCLHVLKLIYVN